MTGYGEASAEVGGSHYFVEVRSLNNKFFKASIRLPEVYQGLEAELESVLRQRLTRGTITLTARCTDASASAAYEINRGALERYMSQLEGLRLGGATLDLGALLSLPGVLQPPADEEDRLLRAREAFSKLLERALDALVEMRRREGRLLRDDLRAQGSLIADRLNQISGASPGVVAEYERRLKTRIEMMLTEARVRIEPADLIRELAIYAERTDIAEEISRLKSHLDQFGTLVSTDDGKPVGRTLDFLAQEMLREANTIASKSPDSTISRAAVEIKGAIDRIKEQAANVE